VNAPDYRPPPAVMKHITYICSICRRVLSQNGVRRHGRECAGAKK